MQVQLSGLIQSIRGTLDKETGAYFTTRNGKTFLCYRRPNARPNQHLASVSPDTIRKTSASQRHQQRFATAQLMTSEIMSSPHLKKAYESRFRSQKTYLTLRGFIFAQMMQMLKN